MKPSLLDYIPTGKENAISAPELSKANGRNVRVNRNIVLTMRKKGVPICSDEHGYYLPADETECRAYIHAQLSRIGNGYAALKPFRALIKREQERYAGQLSVSDFLGKKEETADSVSGTVDGTEID